VGSGPAPETFRFAPWGQLVSDTTTLSAGDRVGNYQVLGLAGAGGMGVVYRALDLKLERTVALKFLPNELVATRADRERFLREARTASALDHPNIGVIHGIEETGDGRSFIVMAYYEGETVARKLLHGPLPPEEAVDIAIQMTRGLAEAHARAVIHRDIKPSNVIITQQNIAKIVDFGLARIAGPCPTTQSMGTAGTFGYMSPEQTMGKLVDQRTDIWALGIVLTEMVTGRNPFHRDNAPATLVAILNEPPTLPDEIPLELQRIIYRALSKEPATRYPTCREMLADLEAFRSHLGPVSASSSAGSQSSGRASADFRKTVERASSTMLFPHPSGRGTWQRWLAGIGAAALVLVLFSLIPALRDRISSFFGRHEEHVAVLPFENVSNSPADEAVSQGLMDSLSSRLTNLDTGKQSLWVVPASEVRRQKIADPGSARRELGATVVVQGSLQRDGQAIRLTVNLIDTKKLRQIGSVALGDPAGDFSTLEDEAVARLASLMQIEVTPEMLRATGGAVAPAAYESYLKALGYMQRHDKPENLDLALDALKSALKTDPGFALGYAQLGEAYRMKFTLDKNPKWTDEALANCRKAAELNTRLPLVYVTLGRIHDSGGQYDLALQEFQRALQLDPRNADALIGLAHAYESLGRITDAEAAYKKAIALRPDYWDGYNNLGVFYDRQDRYDEAIAQLRHAVELTPDNARVYLNLAAVYIDSGDSKRFPEAEQVLKKSIELSPTYPAYANLGYLYIQEQEYAEAATTIEKALKLNDKDFLIWGNLALAYQGLKQQDKVDAARDRQMLSLEQAAKSDPRDGQVQSYLGLVYAQKKMRDKALPRLQSALVLSPDDNVVLENIGEAYEELGDRARALYYIHQSLQKGYGLAALKSNLDLQSLLSDPNFRPNGK
jgi:serine/threonine protein kinase/Flp pilus assembly protein TadD